MLACIHAYFYTILINHPHLTRSLGGGERAWPEIMYADIYALLPSRTVKFCPGLLDLEELWKNCLLVECIMALPVSV
jgi:hypothetical protein